MMTMQAARIRISVAVAALTGTAAANAVIVMGNGESVNLGALLSQGSDRKVQIDDKLFTFKAFTSSAFRSADVTVVAYVSTTTNQWGLHNVGFDIRGQFGDSTPGNGSAAEMNLQYTVEVLDEWYTRDVRLCDTHLGFDGQAGGTGSFARVDETVLDLDLNRYLGNLSAWDNAGPPRSTRLTDAVDFCDRYGTSGYRAFEVNKDIKFLATAGGFSQASFVRQEFSQIMAPGPGAVALLGIAGMLGARRRR